MVVALAATMLFSCKNNFNEVQQIGVLQNAPIGEADTIHLKHTDSSKLIADLKSPKMFDYSNRPFGYSEFPKGIELTIFDKEGNPSKIFADYAISYLNTDLIDLRGNVLLATYTKDSLFTTQMYYDQKNEWVFTNEDYRLKKGYTDISGRGFDSSRNFKTYEMHEPSGPIEFNN
ncbi:LPS export ABC transporter periplasmic protein LptC [Winogradskyella maritima]|nr:LPS export ABC transporter periplasmic protein LptC [Winogradskyella maritima]